MLIIISEIRKQQNIPQNYSGCAGIIIIRNIPSNHYNKSQRKNSRAQNLIPQSRHIYLSSISLFLLLSGIYPIPAKKISFHLKFYIQREKSSLTFHIPNNFHQCHLYNITFWNFHGMNLKNYCYIRIVNIIIEQYFNHLD